MKSRVIYSTFSTVLTIILDAVLVFACCASAGEKPLFFILLACLLIVLISALFYAPCAIKADSRYIVMSSILKSRRILMSHIAGAELFQPTLGAVRVFGSGGYMGYWGIFREGDIGRYQAFYGKASDCFLIRMKNGDKYLLGCENPSAMVDYINSQIDN